MAIFLIKAVSGGGFNSATPVTPLRTLATANPVDSATWTEIIPNATLAVLRDRAPNGAMLLACVNTSGTTVMQVAAMPGVTAPTTEVGEWLPANSRNEFVIDSAVQSIWFRVAAIT